MHCKTYWQVLPESKLNYSAFAFLPDRTILLYKVLLERVLWHAKHPAIRETKLYTIMAKKNQKKKINIEEYQSVPLTGK